MLRNAQIEKERVEAENEELQLKLVHVQKSRSKHKKREVAAPASEEESAFQKYSKAFTVMNHFYVLDGLQLLSTPSDPEYSELDPFINPAKTLDGLACELDDLLPENLQERRLEDPERLELVVSIAHTRVTAGIHSRLGSQFKNGAQAVRHSLTHRVRSEYKMYPDNIANAMKTAAGRENSEVLKALLGWDGKRYSRMPPLLLGDPNKPADANNMFYAPLLMQVSLEKPQHRYLTHAERCSHLHR